MSAVSFSGWKSKLFTRRYDCMYFNRLFINLLFWNDYRCIGTCKNSTERFLCTLHPVSRNYSTMASGVNDLQRPTRNTRLVEQVGFMTHCSEGEHAPWETAGHLCKRMVKRACYGIWAFVGWFWGSLRSWGSCQPGCCQKAEVLLWWGISNLVSRKRRQAWG